MVDFALDSVARSIGFSIFTCGTLVDHTSIRTINIPERGVVTLRDPFLPHDAMQSAVR